MEATRPSEMHTEVLLTSPAAVPRESSQPRESSSKSPSTNRIRASKSLQACRRCHKRKVKCSGDVPCVACKISGHDGQCVYDGREGRRSENRK